MRAPALLSILLLLSMLLAGCSPRPRGILGKEKMTEVMRDMILAETLCSYNSYPDSVERAMYLEVLAKHRVPKEVYDASLVWYIRNTSELNDIYETLSKTFADAHTRESELLSDSIRSYRIRMEDPKDLWGTSETRRLLIPRSDLFALLYNVSDLPTAPAQGDTLRWTLRLSSPLAPSERLILRMRAASPSDADARPIDLQRELSGSDSTRWVIEYICPISGQTSGKITTALYYFRSDSTFRSLPLLVDSIRLSLHSSFPEPMVSSPSPEEEQPSTR